MVIALDGVPLDHDAQWLERVLLILGGEDLFVQLRASLIHSPLREILGMKQVTSTTQVIQALPDLDLLVSLGNQGQLQDGPTIGMLQNRATQVVRCVIAA